MRCILAMTQFEPKVEMIMSDNKSNLFAVLDNFELKNAPRLAKQDHLSVEGRTLVIVLFSYDRLTFCSTHSLLRT